MLRLSDGSTLTMPREFHGRQTDFDVNGNLAGALVSQAHQFRGVASAIGVGPGRLRHLPKTSR